MAEGTTRKHGRYITSIDKKRKVCEMSFIRYNLSVPDYHAHDGMSHVEWTRHRIRCLDTKSARVFR